MSAPINSFRLQRLTKTVGLKEQSHNQYHPKQTFKLAALNSINRSIKYNDLSFAQGKTNLNKLRKQPQIQEDIQYSAAHHNLDNVRKNFDSVHKDKVKRQVNISKLKEQRTKLKIFQGQFLDKKNEGKKKVDDLKSQRQRVKLMLEEAETHKKVLLQMRNRLKKDKVVYDLRKYNLQHELKFLKTQQNVFHRDGTQIQEEDDRVNKVFKKYLQQLQSERDQRIEHLESMEYMIEQKRRVNQINEQREREIMQIAERAMQDKDGNEKNWEKLYLTNKLVTKMLKDKMDKEMVKFSVVENAFKTIKISTGVSDAQTLVKKFLNKEADYGDLLGRIAQNEKRIEFLKNETEDLLQEQKVLEGEQENLGATKRVNPVIEKQAKELQEMNDQSKKTFLLREKLRNWIIKTLKKINLVIGTNHKTTVGRDKDHMVEGFFAYLTIFREELKKAQETEVQHEKFDSNQKIKNEKKTIRISHLNKDPYEDESEEEPTVNYEQSDMISQQRGQLHKRNEKFMKQLQKKAEELRRAKAEAMVPKKQEKVVQKPKEEVE